MSKTYIYIGDVPTQLLGVGIIQPYEEVKVDREINNPLFKEKVEEKRQKKNR